MAHIFQGQTARLEVDGVTVGALQDAEISAEFEDTELEGQSIKRLDVQRTAVRISVSATYGKFDLDGIKELIGYDEEQGGIKDSPQPPSFDITGKFESTDGEEDFEGVVKEVIFNEITLDWARDDHVQENLTGEGKDIEFIDNSE